MEDLENKISAIMANPELMGQIMSLANSLGQEQPDSQASAGETFGGMDLQMLQKLSGLAGQSNIDSNQKNLLTALVPYISQHRITKLEKAMRAAKMARLASTFLGR